MHDHLPPQVGIPIAIVLWLLVAASATVSFLRYKQAKRRMRRETHIAIKKQNARLEIEANRVHIALPVRKVR